MNAEKLKELTERAAKASARAKEIEQLRAANRYTHDLKFTVGGDRYRDALPLELLYQLFDIGKAKLIEQKEAELAELLGENNPPVLVEIPVVDPRKSEPWVYPVASPSDGTLLSFQTVTCDQAIGTLDSSDTWEQPS